ncbi:adenylate/guanylate cyclase domain-containing protein [Nocardioides mangrovicus]|uniref:Adenylate/guanylate cyclase domain-containing protein n=1 Tax=Nocardioides mangrovicus TaxID=2478913 RepID=A0A3L8P3A8_9ACTN|nr:adenylate/guanylate cyclase domain-containing protein [Nocardioides mangrovicus]RLV49926.1 adenylate/guanylate cyclase domain-containing protein [Nocardioides mangrovicus]
MPEQPYSRARLEESLLGAAPELSTDELAQVVEEQLDIEPEDARRFWRALGFPDPGSGSAFTSHDVDALRVVSDLLSEGLVDRDTLLRMTRAIGSTVSRLAEWEVNTLVGRVEELESGDQATGSRIGSALRLHDGVGRPFEALLLYAWHRHLSAAVARVEALGARDEDLRTTEVTVGFADLVGFSAWSNEHSQEQIGRVVEAFEDRASDAVALHGGRVVKTLGDSVLYVCAGPVAAYDIADDVVREVGGDLELPDVRVGLATGPVQLRLGDVFGPAVNLAARMTSVARRNRIIADQRTADLLPAEQFQVRVLPARPVRGFGDLEPVAVRRR